MAESNNPLVNGVPKKKKHLWGLWVPLIVIACLIIVPFGIVMAFLYDPGHVDSGVDKEALASTTVDQLFNNIIVDALDPCRPSETNSDPSMELVISQKALNEFLYVATKGMDSTITSFIPQITYNINEDDYTFDIEVSAWNVAKTHIRLDTVIYPNYLDEEKNDFCFYFVISDLEVGRLNGIREFGIGLLKQLGLDGIIADAFKSSNLSIQVDLDNYCMKYYYADFVNDMAAITGDSSTADLFGPMIYEFLTIKDSQGKNVLSFSHTANTEIRGSAGLTDFTNNALYASSNLTRDFKLRDKFDKVVNAIQTIQAQGGGNYSNAELQAILNFVAFGGNVKLTDPSGVVDAFFNDDQVVNVVLGEGFNKSNYKELYKNQLYTQYFDKGPNIQDVMKDQVINAMKDNIMNVFTKIQDGSETEIPLCCVTMNEATLSSQLKDCPALGNGVVFSSGIADTYKANFIFTDNIYVSIRDNTLVFVLGLNINGTETVLCVPGPANSSSDGGAISFDFSSANVQLGSLPTSGTMNTCVMNLISNLNTISVPGLSFSEDNKLEINVKPFVEQGLNDCGDQFIPAGTIPGDKKLNDFAKDQGYNLIIKISAHSEDKEDSKGYLSFDIKFSK